MAERIPFILGSIVYRLGPTPFHFLKLVWPGYACLGGLAIQVFIGILKYSNSEEKCFGVCLNDLRLKLTRRAHDQFQESPLPLTLLSFVLYCYHSTTAGARAIGVGLVLVLLLLRPITISVWLW